MASPDFSPLPESGDKLSNQPAGLLGIKPLVANSSTAATSVHKYFEDDLQRILEAVLEIRAPVPTPDPALAPIVSKAP